MRLQGPNWDARRVYQIRNAKLHAHNDGRVTHITSGEVFLETEPVAIHVALQVCITHWRIWSRTEPPTDDGGPNGYGFELDEECDVKTCEVRWFYDVTDNDPVTEEMPTI